MEVLEDRLVHGTVDSSPTKDFIQISCNWRITNNKQFREAITTEPSSQKPKTINLDDVVSLETCISLRPDQYEKEPCVLDIKLTNGQRISHVAVASEFHVLELFKEYGEYELTIVSSFEDEFEDTQVYFGESPIFPPSTEVSIKFASRRGTAPEVWVYGIKLYLTEPSARNEDAKDAICDPEMIKWFLTNLSRKRNGERSSCNRNILNTADRVRSLDQRAEERNENLEEENSRTSKNQSKISSFPDMTKYIDNKFHEIETRLTKRIEEMERRTNQKLDAILKHLESQSSAK